MIDHGLWIWIHTEGCEGVGRYGGLRHSMLLLRHWRRWIRRAHGLGRKVETLLTDIIVISSRGGQGSGLLTRVLTHFTELFELTHWLTD